MCQNLPVHERYRKERGCPFSYSIQIIRSGSQIRDFGAVDIVAIHFLRAEEEASKTDAFAKSVSSAESRRPGRLSRKGEPGQIEAETRDPCD